MQFSIANYYLSTDKIIYINQHSNTQENLFSYIQTYIREKYLFTLEEKKKAILKKIYIYIHSRTLFTYMQENYKCTFQKLFSVFPLSVLSTRRMETCLQPPPAHILRVRVDGHRCRPALLRRADVLRGDEHDTNETGRSRGRGIRDAGASHVDVCTQEFSVDLQIGLF